MYEHADLVVFVPAGGALLDLFDDSHSLATTQSHFERERCFDFTSRPEAGTSRNSSNSAQWTQNDFFVSAHSEYEDEEATEHIPAVLDDLDDDKASATLEVNSS